MDVVKEILTSYYFWMAVEAVVIIVLFIFVRKFAKLKKSRKAEIRIMKEQSQYNMLDEQITGRKGSN